MVRSAAVPVGGTETSYLLDQPDPEFNMKISDFSMKSASPQ